MNSLYPTITPVSAMLISDLCGKKEFQIEGFSYQFEDPDILVSVICLSTKVPFAISGEPGDKVDIQSKWVRV